MGTELLTAAALVEVRRATGRLWNDGPEVEAGAGFVRRALTATVSAFEAAVGKLRSTGASAETSAAPAAGD